MKTTTAALGGVATIGTAAETGGRTRLLPKADNDYRGHRFAVWLLWPMILGNGFLFAVHVFLHDSGAQQIGTMPLDTYAPNAAATIVAFVAQWGLKQGLTAALCAVVLWRYRAWIPLIFAFLAFEQVAKMAIGGFKPIHTVETPPGAAITVAMTVCALVGFVLALRQREGAAS